MADFIVLSRAQADAVRGNSTPSAALDPIELKDGTFVLPLAVLTDPAHTVRRTALQARASRSVVDVEWKWTEKETARPLIEADAGADARVI